MSALVAVRTKRQQLGEAIAFSRNDLGASKHNLADKTRSTIKEVDRWEQGELVPTSQEWQRMRQVFPAFNARNFLDLYAAAAAEQKSIEQAKDERATPTAKPTSSTDLDAAVRMLLEVMPGLISLTIEVGEDGEASVSFRTRQVRIVEDHGNLQVRR